MMIQTVASHDTVHSEYQEHASRLGFATPSFLAHLLSRIGIWDVKSLPPQYCGYIGAKPA